MQKEYWYALAALVAVWFLFLRKKTSVTGGANLSIATGNNQQNGYTGYPAGQYPPGVNPAPYSTNAPSPPSPIIIQGQNQDTTGNLLQGIGGLIGGIGSAAGNVLNGLGNSGLLSNGGSNGYSGGGGSYSGGGGDTSSIDDGI